MSMERRALIAMVLMVVVLLFYWVYAPRGTRAPEPAPPEAAGPGAAAPGAGRDSVIMPEKSASDSSTVVAAGIPLAGAAGQEVYVTTPLISATFSTAGGILTSFRLKDYLDEQDNPVELIPETEEDALAVELLTHTGERIDLGGADFEPSATSLDVPPGGEAMLTFTMRTEQGLEVVKSLRFRSDTYIIGCSVDIGGGGSIRAAEIGWQSGLKTTEANKKDDLRSFATLTMTEEGLAKYDLGKVKKRDVVKMGGEIAWTGIKTKYFLAAFAPVGGGRAVSRSYMVGEEAIGLSVEFDRPEMEPQAFLLYAGPLDYNRLKALDLRLEEAVDFGWRWISPLTRLVFRFMLFVQRGVPNYGLVILILSVLIKILFWPLTQKSMKSMHEMQKMQPMLNELKQKHKDDPKKFNEEMWKLYREKGVNPAGGCLPMLLQMPVFVALFNLLSKTIELRRAPFMLWIQDLSAPDVIGKLPFTLPFIGSNVSVLPILMGIAMFIQQKMTASDPKNATMTYMLPIIFTVIFYRFPSGLVLYWLVNNILSIMHQYLLARADRPQTA